MPRSNRGEGSGPRVRLGGHSPLVPANRTRDAGDAESRASPFPAATSPVGWTVKPFYFHSALDLFPFTRRRWCGGVLLLMPLSRSERQRWRHSAEGANAGTFWPGYSLFNSRLSLPRKDV
jgi:hypothetical protein